MVVVDMRRAVVSYEANATDDQKIAALKDGIRECAEELAELGVPLGMLQDVLDEALSAAEEVKHEQEGQRT